MTAQPGIPSFKPDGPPGFHEVLAKHTGFLISRLGMVAQKRFAELLDKLGLNPRMWGVLNVLDVEGAITQHALGKLVGIDPSSMVSTIDELEAKGLVERRPHPTDRRAHALYMTELGRRMLAQGRKLARTAQEELLAPLSAEEREQLHSMLLRNDREAIMIDAGTGVSRLIERPEYLDGVEKLDIVLTHFHLDHIAGLAYLPAVGVCEETTVWGPGALLYSTATDALLAQVSHEPFHPVSLDAQDVEVRDLPAEELELAGVQVAIRRQDRHSAPSLALRFGDELAWITDTACDPGSISFAEGCQLLAHEAWFVSERPRNPEIHSSAAEAAEVANGAGIERLLLIHLPPFEQSVAELELESQRIVPQALSAQDGVDMSVLLAA